MNKPNKNQVANMWNGKCNLAKEPPSNALQTQTNLNIRNGQRNDSASMRSISSEDISTSDLPSTCCCSSNATNPAIKSGRRFQLLQVCLDKNRWFCLCVVYFFFSSIKLIFDILFVSFICQSTYSEVACKIQLLLSERWMLLGNSGLINSTNLYCESLKLNASLGIMRRKCKTTFSNFLFFFFKKRKERKIKSIYWQYTAG